MESSGASIGSSRRSQPGALRLTQAGLLIASLGAVLVVFDPFGLGVVGIFLASAAPSWLPPAASGRAGTSPSAGGAIGVAPVAPDRREPRTCGRLAGGDCLRWPF